MKNFLRVLALFAMVAVLPGCSTEPDTSNYEEVKGGDTTGQPEASSNAEDMGENMGDYEKQQAEAADK